MGKTALKYLLGMAGWAYFTAVQAVSLSEAELTSYLNQPLNARVMLGGISPAELASLQVSFVQVAAGAGGAYISLTSELVDDATGQYIHISSKQIIREPVVTFILELAWTGGRMQREYSLLLDPKN